MIVKRSLIDRERWEGGRQKDRAVDLDDEDARGLRHGGPH